MRKVPLILAVIFTCFFSSRAQDTLKTKVNGVRVHLITMQWKAIEGYFQSPTNKDLFLRTTTHDTVLLVKYLWTNNEDTLYPESELVFSNNESDDKASRLVFSKDSSGLVNRVLNGDETWNRVSEYKPVVKKEMPHTPAQLRPFEGVYHFENDTNALVQFMVKGNDLVLKDNQETHFIPGSELSFYKPDNIWFTIDFSKDASGKVKQAVIIKRTVLIKNPKPSITVAQLRSYEGKYRSKSDSDNIIQLIVKGRQLVIKQLWNGEEIVVTPLADLYFYNAAESLSLQFVRDGDGAVRQAWLFDKDEFDKQTSN
jgi:hypothetical protein